MKYFITTYGCQMNKSDSERIAADLENKGWKSASKIDEANLIVVNMCSVRQSAVDRVFGISQKLSKLKSQNSNLKTILTGCILKKDRVKFRKIFDDLKPQPWLSYYVKPKYQSNTRAYIPISNGCNNFCTYCVVPYTRGPLVCRGPKEILKETRQAIKKGFKEIWLLGQNVNDYYPIPFAELLRKVLTIPGDFQIRFTSPYPMNFSDELIEVMANSKKVAKYLNLPVQSGDNKILSKMNRPYTVEQYKKLVKKIRKRIPNINLSTDVIVGFPGETKKQFENTVKLFKEIKFNMAYIAKYSPRSGTAAFQLKDNVSLGEKKRREKCLRNLLSS